jgi:glyoxylate reductase
VIVSTKKNLLTAQSKFKNVHSSAIRVMPTIPASPTYSRPKILVDKPFPEEHTKWLQDRADVVFYDGNEEAAEAAGSDIQGILWYGHSPVNEQLLSKFSNVKVVSNFGAGYEHFDAPAILARNLPMGHTPGCLSETVADFAWGLMLCAARDIVGGVNRCQQASFDHINSNVLGKQVSGATLGIVGMGSIGSCIAKRARGFSMNVLYHNRTQKSPEEEEECSNATFCSSFEELLQKSDYVMLTCPVTPETENFMGTSQFKLMKKDAILINMGRGKLVDQDALIEALASDEIGMAALDVTEPEPLPRDHPLVIPREDLRGKIIISPHQGSATLETRFQMLTMSFDNLLAGLEGKKLPWLCKECIDMDGQRSEDAVGEKYWTNE